LVDDEPALLDLLTTELSRDFDIDTARSVDEADLSMATRPYDAVVCDHVMVGEAGLSFLARVKDRYPGTIRILVTGYMNPDLIARATKIAGLTACLIKPVAPAKISQAILSVLQP
jgi:two-component system response regulator HupR/HoxA